MVASVNALTSSGGGVVVAGDASGILQLQTNGTPTVTVDTSGNVGIGTNSPASKLDVNGMLYTESLPIVWAHSYGAGNYQSWFVANCTSDEKYKASEPAYRMRTVGPNGFIWETAGTGTAGNAISFTERMRLDTSGWLSIGRTSGGGRVNIQANTNNFMAELYNQSGTSVGSISTNGTTTTYGTSSDYRLKENVQPMTGALSVVTALKPCTYTWKADGSDGQGFIAHELQEVVPDCVTGEKDAVNKDGSIKPQSIDTSFLVATLTAAIQELKAINDTQAQAITNLTERLAVLEAK